MSVESTTPTRIRGRDSHRARIVSTDIDRPADWIAAIARERSRSGFVTLFTRFAPRVKAYLLRHGVDEQVADDLTQDVFVVIWRKASLFDPKRASASAWIHTITRNLWIDAVRQSRRRIDDARIAIPLEIEPTPEDQLKSSEGEARLRAALDSLPGHQAEVLRLSFFEEQTHPQIAERLGVPLGTVKSRIRLATAHLRRALQDLA